MIVQERRFGWRSAKECTWSNCGYPRTSHVLVGRSEEGNRKEEIHKADDNGMKLLEWRGQENRWRREKGWKT